MVEALEVLHEAGYVHQDIKPENILLGSSNYNNRKSSEFHLVDYGLSCTYRKEDGSHEELRTVSKFCGNIMFAAKSAFHNLR